MTVTVSVEAEVTEDVDEIKETEKRGYQENNEEIIVESDMVIVIE